MDLLIQPPLPKKRNFRIGILGSGSVVNECHLPAYRKAGFNPVAIASRHRRNAEQTAQRHGIPRVYDSYEDLLNDPSIEVLDIAVPPQAQLNLIRRACARKTVRGIPHWMIFQTVTGNIPYTPRVKRVLARASKEAKKLSHAYIGTEHILLGLLREADGGVPKYSKASASMSKRPGWRF
jgi:hypothetical protein